MSHSAATWIFTFEFEVVQELGHFSVEDFTVPDEELEDEELEEEPDEELDEELDELDESDESDEPKRSEPLPEQPARKSSATSGARVLVFDIKVPSKINLK
ncbi:hypothetical protein [Martelella sp. HB161492]|uniref:hypothetical protein n=1 Tax=Martelella sp. HB161492 TaxID=2720726 RepID=UPI00158FD2D5|nr:hypothetical protein [Martelella sp. HB161492]